MTFMPLLENNLVQQVCSFLISGEVLIFRASYMISWGEDFPSFSILIFHAEELQIFLFKVSHLFLPTVKLFQIIADKLF